MCAIVRRMDRRFFMIFLLLLIATSRTVSAQELKENTVKTEQQQKQAERARRKAIQAMKKDIAQARTYLKAGNNFDKAEQLMQNQLRDSANRYHERLWLIMFDAVKKQYEQGNMKLYLKQKYDTASLFNLTKRMFTIAEAFDSIDNRGDGNENAKPQYRKRHAEFLDRYRSNLFNGGSYFVAKQKFADAYSFFDLYLDCAHQPLFSQYKYAETDSRMAEAAYWAVYCGYKMRDPKATLHHTYLALKDTAHYDLMLQYLADTYKLEGDTARYVQTLTEGFQKYPLFPFFYPRLVDYYAGLGQWGDVLQITDRAISFDSLSVNFRIMRASALLNLAKYGECITLCDSLIAHNDSLSEAWYNAGMSYFNQAVAIDKKLKQTAKQKQFMQECYQKSRYYMEHFRQLVPEQTERWALPLYTIYLNLNMGKEFDEVESIIRRKKK